MTQVQPSETDQTPTHAHLLQRAYSGDVTAMATLMNRHLIRQQMTAHVTWDGNRLHVLVEAVHVPTPESLFSVIYRTVRKLQVHTLEALRVTCQQVDADQIAWSLEQAVIHEIDDETTVLPPEADRDRQPIPAPISLQDWLNQQAQPSLAELIQPIPATSETETEERFLRFALSASETALLPLSQIRQVMQVQSHNLLTVPDMPAFVLGISNFHGEMLWMVDLGLQLGFQGTSMGWDRPRSLSSVGGEAVPSAGHWMAIVIQAHGHSLGLIVSQVIDIESYDPTQLQSPTIDLFPPTLLPFMQGYLIRSSSPVLDVNTVIADHRLQLHPLQ